MVGPVEAEEDREVGEAVEDGVGEARGGADKFGEGVPPNIVREPRVDKKKAALDPGHDEEPGDGVLE